MQRHESPNVPFTIFKTRFVKGMCITRIANFQMLRAVKSFLTFENVMTDNLTLTARTPLCVLCFGALGLPNFFYGFS